MRLYQSACHVVPVRRRVLLKRSFMTASRKKGGMMFCWYQKWGSEWFLYTTRGQVFTQHPDSSSLYGAAQVHHHHQQHNEKIKPYVQNDLEGLGNMETV